MNERSDFLEPGITRYPWLFVFHPIVTETTVKQLLQPRVLATKLSRDDSAITSFLLREFLKTKGTLLAIIVIEVIASTRLNNCFL
ncbi:MAG: hypothetical protein WCV90_02050 [Candidatus Woesearchaeota archaeon]